MRRIVLIAGMGFVAFLSWRFLGAEPRAEVRKLPNPARPGSMAPSLSAGPDGKVILSWLEPAAAELALKFAEWDGKTWSRPEMVAQRSDFDVYAEAPPSVLRLAGGTVLAIWGQDIKTGGKWDGSYLFSNVSANGGKHWSPSIRVHSDTSLSEHSFSSVIGVGPAQALVIWLDARDYDTKDRYRLMSAVVDSKGTVSDEKTVDSDTCTCCPTALIRAPQGALAAYRGHNPEDIRDIKVARLADGNWQQAHTVHDDLWKINACPVNGPALASEGRRLAVLWFTASQDKPEVKIAMSNDLGSTFQAPVTLDSPNGDDRPVGHVALSLLEDGDAIAVWLHHGASGTELIGERISSAGQHAGRFTIASGAETGFSYPRIQRLGDQLVISWTGKSNKGVRTATIFTGTN
ncbi:MAG TPA: sialidase family protein [Patescibacteria group bacterium]|nr:sialidase family protein [Patescibacteria group bacterium]